VNVKHPKDTDLKPIDELQLDVFYGIQEFDFADSSNKPIILISANYDSLGAAPSMQAGVERSVSSILSVMHLSRLFGGKSSHQSNTDIQTEYEIMYVLSPGASINYEATSQFIDFLPA